MTASSLVVCITAPLQCYTLQSLSYRLSNIANTAAYAVHGFAGAELSLEVVNTCGQYTCANSTLELLTRKVLAAGVEPSDAACCRVSLNFGMTYRIG
jgi:hypothetical protein